VSLLLTFTIAFALAVTDYKKKIKALKEDLSLMLSQKKSSEVRLGQISEQLAPFLKDFKYDPKKAHFLGNPIDYVIFDENEIVFLEVKSGESRMSKKQKDIKNMIAAGKVRFDSMQIK
jgi:predicted Holliday junction resolvase-like endonuclease